MPPDQGLQMVCLLFQTYPYSLSALVIPLDPYSPAKLDGGNRDTISGGA